MVRKYESPIRVYKYPFEFIMKAYELRFPTCDLIPLFVIADILSEVHSSEASQTITKRRCKFKVDAPYLLKKLIGMEFVYFKQTNYLDRKRRVLKIVGENETFSSKIVVSELCYYWVHPDNEHWTCFEQKADLTIKNFYGFENLVEKLLVKNYTDAIAKSKELLYKFIDQLLSSGVTQVPIWRERDVEVIKEDFKNYSNDAILFDPSLPPDFALLSKIEESYSLEAADHDKSFPPSNHYPIQTPLQDAYIHKYLGDLTPLQESSLIQLRNILKERHTTNEIPKDLHILRFLKARDFSIEKGEEMINSSLLWRKHNQIDKHLSNYETPKVISDYYPGGWTHTHDKDGRPIYALMYGVLDVKGFYKSLGQLGILYHVIKVCEESFELCEKATNAFKHPVTSWTLLIDLDGLSMRQFWGPVFKILLEIIQIVQLNYPETMGLFLFVRAPSIFPKLWSLISSFIEEKTAEKIIVFANDEHIEDEKREGLSKFIEANNIPSFLNGTNNKFEGWKVGSGIIPSNFYLPASQLNSIVDSQTLNAQSSYHSGSIYRFQNPFEVLVSVKNKGTILSWDYDVIKGNCIFRLIELIKVPPSLKSLFSDEANNSNTLKPNTPFAEMENVINNERNSCGEITALTKAAISIQDMKENEDYAVLECFESFNGKDGNQGSYIVNNSSYNFFILQWTLNEFDCSSPTFEFPSLTGPKCKIAYYYELINPEVYKANSHTSLQSLSLSEFSCLSFKSDNSNKNPT